VTCPSRARRRHSGCPVTRQLSGLGDELNVGANIKAWSCDGTASQYWRTLNSPASASGYYYLQNYNSHDVIGVGGASTANGASLVQWPQVGHPDQYWTGS
jgi:hypothetical protein